jgi:uncharacterized membrane protein YeiH
MASEYSYVPIQTVVADILFTNGARACKKHLIQHRDDSGIFTLRGERNACKAIYKVEFRANIAVSAAADGGVLEPISVALTQNSEVLRNTISIVTPAAIGDFFTVSFGTFIELECGCCATVSVKNTSANSTIDVQNANIIIERVA